MSLPKPSARYYHRTLLTDRRPALLQDLLDARKSATRIVQELDGILRSLGRDDEDSQRTRLIRLCCEITQDYLKSGKLPPVDLTTVERLEKRLGRSS